MSQKKPEVSPFVSAMIGGLTGAAEISCTYPNEYIKTCMQLYPKMNKQGAINLAKTTIKEHGILSKSPETNPDQDSIRDTQHFFSFRFPNTRSDLEPSSTFETTSSLRRTSYTHSSPDSEEVLLKPSSSLLLWRPSRLNLFTTNFQRLPNTRHCSRVCTELGRSTDSEESTQVSLQPQSNSPRTRVSDLWSSKTHRSS